MSYLNDDPLKEIEKVHLLGMAIGALVGFAFLVLVWVLVGQPESISKWAALGGAIFFAILMMLGGRFLRLDV